MSSNAGKGVVPKLRFPEFQDAPPWVQTTLGKEATFRKGKGIAKEDISPTGVQPCIRYGEIYTYYGTVIDKTISFTNAPAGGLVLSKKDDVLIPASGETEIDIATASCLRKSGIAIGGDLNVIRSRMDGAFLAYYLSSAKRRSIAKLAQGISVVHLYAEQLQALSIDIPGQKAEQNEIADCLSSIDDIITTETQKIAALKAYKKGLMQQLFPAEGETVPRLRFPKFRDGPDWQIQKISNVLKRVSNPVNVGLNEMYQQIGIRSHGKGIFHKELVSGEQLGNKRVFWVEGNAFVVNIVFAWEQAVATTSRAEKGMIASHRFPMYRARSNKTNVNFIAHFFLTRKGKNLLALASPGGAGRNRTLGQKDFENLEFPLPLEVAEQIKIADSLSSVDGLIAAQTQELDMLKAHKEGLMQGLFPASREGEV